MRIVLFTLIVVLLSLNEAHRSIYRSEGSVSKDFCTNPQKPCVSYVIDLEKK